MAYIGTPAAPVATVVGDNAVTTRSIAPNAVTPPKLANSGAELSFRNRIINGDMRIDQRNAGAAVTNVDTSGYYAVDRWRTMGGTWGVGRVSLQRVSDAPTGFNFSNKTTVTTAVSIPSSGTLAVGQGVEGFTVADLGWGTAAAATVTVSFWAKASVAGSYGLSLLTGDETRAYRAQFTLASNAWEYKTIVIPGDTSGAWLTDNSFALRVAFVMDAGTKTATLNTWQSSGNYAAPGQVSMFTTSGATFQFTGVQLEAGTVATPFERRDYGRELMMCQRYYQIKGWYEAASNATTIPLAPDMRATPTVTFSNNGWGGTPSSIFGGDTFWIGVQGAAPVWSALCRCSSEL